MFKEWLAVALLFGICSKFELGDFRFYVSIVGFILAMGLYTRAVVKEALRLKDELNDLF